MTDPVHPGDELDLGESPPSPAELLGMVDAATGRLQETAAAIGDERAREPSLLPGWSRGHVLTHLARNADSLRNLLIWARTGVVTPQYASVQEREDGIAAGADRPAAELLADLAATATAFAAEAATVPEEAWQAQVGGLRGDAHPAWYTLWRRLQEVEIHHVDLDAGFGPDDWPAVFATTTLRRAARDIAGRTDCPAVILTAGDTGAEYVIGPSGQVRRAAVSGPTRELLAWLIGRSDGLGLAVQPTGPLPPLPAW